MRQFEEPQHLVVFTDRDRTGKRQQEASGGDEHEEPHRDDFQGPGQHHQVQHQAAGGQHEQEQGVAHHLSCSWVETDSCDETEPHQREVRCESRG